MRKKVVIALFAVMGWVAVSHTAVNAATCLSWKTIGGSSMCVAWATKGVQVLIAFRDGCFVAASDVTPDLLAAGANTSPSAVVGCNVTATAFSTDAPTSIAFCGPNHVKVACDQPFSFGPAFLGAGTAVECVEHPDNESQTGENHEQHRCVAAATLPIRADTLANCNTCCMNAGFGPTCTDLTPVEMQTRLDSTYPIPGGGDEEGTPPPCSTGSFECTVGQTCSINPKKIAFIPLSQPQLGKEYQCNLDCSGGPEACPVAPPPPCDGECLR